MSNDNRIILNSRDQYIHDAVSQELGVTDAQLQLLSAIDKARLLKALVHNAVENILGLNLTWDEKVVVLAFREWRDSSKSVSGVFHCKAPKNADIKRISNILKAESSHNAAQIEASAESRPTCAHCGQRIEHGDYKLVDDYGDSFHALCVEPHVSSSVQQSTKTESEDSDAEAAPERT
jgi:CRISPR/Cas system-associated protein Cas10 (large subunit of type III CRISPR-Cas system)